MSTDAHDRALQLDDARRCARQASSDDVEALLRPCPASQAEIFVVPLRYALAETPLAHPMCPLEQVTLSHPMAARRLRSGYVYLWHHQGPLKRFAVAVDGRLLEQPLAAPAGQVEAGELYGLALDKHEAAWLLFTEHPLGPAQCERLSDAGERDRHMRQVDLRRVANTLQAPHCPSVDDAEQVLGELQPQVYSTALAVEFARDGAQQRRDANELGDAVDKNPTDATIDRYHDARRQHRERRAAAAQHPEIDADSPLPGRWSAERWDALATKSWLEAIRLEAEPLYAVFACLDDELGVLRDINHEQEQLQAEHEQWLQDHGLRLHIGGFVRSLLEESASELTGLLNYRYREQDIQLTTAQGEQMLKAHHELDQLLREETRINHDVRRQHGDKQARLELDALWQRKATCLHPIHAIIPPELHNEIEGVVRGYRAEKVANLNHWNGQKVEDYIDLEAMNAWLDQTAPAQFERVRLRQEILFKDRGLYLYLHQRATWWVDPNDIPTRHWLDDLAIACLSAQCLSQQGAEQYTEYVQSTDPGILRQLFFGWTPNLENTLVSVSRMAEVEAALAAPNREQAVLALHKLLMPLSKAVMHELSLLGGPQDTKWSLLVSRLGAALIALGQGGSDASGLSPAWASLLVMARLSTNSPLRWLTEAGQRSLQFVGGAGRAMAEWTQRTAMGIKLGKVAEIRNAPIIQNSGGVLPLAVMLLNMLNARHYLGQLKAVARPDDQRIYDTMSSAMYAGAALTAVLDNQIRKGVKTKAFEIKAVSVPVMTFLGAVMGMLSAGAAVAELESLSTQLENSSGFVDPWLQGRRSVVVGQVATYALQALAGLYWTARVILGLSTVGAAVAGFIVLMRALVAVIAGLGVLYLLTWLFQQKPLQNFLENCCWSKGRAKKLAPITADAQQVELGKLLEILYAPRVGFTSDSHIVASPKSPRSTEMFSVIDSLVIDFPGAGADNVALELAMVGYALDKEAMTGQAVGALAKTAEQPKRWVDLAESWISTSSCEWIPAEEGQGLRLKGAILESKLFSQPIEILLRIRYRVPFAALLGERYFVGGEAGMTWSLTNNAGVLTLRKERSELLDRATNHVLAREGEISPSLQPGVRR